MPAESGHDIAVKTQKALGWSSEPLQTMSFQHRTRAAFVKVLSASRVIIVGIQRSDIDRCSFDISISNTRDCSLPQLVFGPFRLPLIPKMQ